MCESAKDSKTAKISLTEMESSVIRMIVGKMTDMEIAFALDFPTADMERCIQSLKDKLGVADRAEVASAGVKLGLVKPEL